MRRGSVSVRRVRGVDVERVIVRKERDVDVERKEKDVVVERKEKDVVERMGSVRRVRDVDVERKEKDVDVERRKDVRVIAVRNNLKRSAWLV